MKKVLALISPQLLIEASVLKTGFALGIDLGTTNSVAAVIALSPSGESGPEVRCLQIEQSTDLSSYKSTLVPSVVALSAAVEYVGEGAKRLRAKLAEKRLKQNRDVFWECKNDIGLRRSYHLAPEGYRSAAEIGGKVLGFIKRAAEKAGCEPIRRTVVTVPASFQVAQRTDTLRAATFAGLPISTGDLLDEPVAAFLDYLFSFPERVASRIKRNSHVVVFDFGGGTCDVAVFDLSPQETGMDISTRAVSRFHRLGGGDIDRAIVHEALIPDLCAENGMSGRELDYDVKRLVLEPSLLAAAESLKVQLCKKIDEARSLGGRDEAAEEQLVATLPSMPPIHGLGRTFTFTRPKLNGTDFSRVLKPFLDHDLLYCRENEYFLTNSLFSPLKDALDRAGLDRSVISMVLVVGGSSLIPQVQDAVRAYFNEADLLTYDDPVRMQTTVARGAAIHAYTKEIFGKPLFRPVAHDSICIRSSTGLHELISKGTSLLGPATENWQVFDGLEIPRTSITTDTTLRVEIVSGSENRVLHTQLWEVPPPVRSGEKLRLEYRFTEDQMLVFRMSLLDAPESQISGKIESPLTHVVNPNSSRLAIEEIEEQMRERIIPEAHFPDKLIELAEHHATINQRERAISILEKALQMRGQPDGRILNLMGIYCGQIGDHERQEKFYWEASRVIGADSPLFNLALAQYQRRDYKAALETLEERERSAADGPGLTLKVEVLEGLKQGEGRQALLRQAIAAYQPIPNQSDWSLSWMETAAQLDRNTELQDKIAQEKRRRRDSHSARPQEGELPAASRTPTVFR